MKALTICQPYAQLIIQRKKKVENREWETNYRGQLLIHAGANRKWFNGLSEHEIQDFGEPVIFGALLGISQLVDVLHIDQIKRGHHNEKYPWLLNYEHTKGTWCWILNDVQRFAEPLPWSGSQGLWVVPDNALPESKTSISSYR